VVQHLLQQIQLLAQAQGSMLHLEHQLLLERRHI
jgi:hypothetical protein